MMEIHSLEMVQEIAPDRDVGVDADDRKQAHYESLDAEVRPHMRASPMTATGQLQE